jgi:putative glutamine amidotransferase
MLALVRSLIGLAPDLDVPLPDRAPEREYLEALARAGAEGVAVESPEQAQSSAISGLLIRGGAFDLPPEWYGQVARARIDPTRPRRIALERDLLLHAEQIGAPVLGICNGAQLMAVVRGGTLVQDLATLWDDALDHERGDVGDRPVHEVAVSDDSRLAGIVGATRLDVNSTHHQAIERPGRDVRIVARAPDGVSEAIEDPGRPFWIGVQWHPERLADSASARLFEAFVEAAVAHARSR